jgi:hypothetical protein
MFTREEIPDAVQFMKKLLSEQSSTPPSQEEETKFPWTQRKMYWDDIVYHIVKNWDSDAHVTTENIAQIVKKNQPLYLVVNNHNITCTLSRSIRNLIKRRMIKQEGNHYKLVEETPSEVC